MSSFCIVCFLNFSIIEKRNSCGCERLLWICNIIINLSSSSQGILDTNSGAEGKDVQCALAAHVTLFLSSLFQTFEQLTMLQTQCHLLS